MTETNKAVLSLANEAISRGDFEGFLAWCTEDTVWTFVGDRTLRGKEAVRKWMGEAYRVPPRFQVAQLVGEGDVVVAIGEITLQSPSGDDTHHAYCDVWTFREGKMAALQAFVVDQDR